MSFKAIRSIILLLATTSMVAAAPAGTSELDPVAVALGVTPDDITSLKEMKDISNFDPTPWTHPAGLSLSPSNPAEWPADVKAQFMVDMKAAFVEVPNTPSKPALSKRLTGAQSPAARAEAAALVANARVMRDVNNEHRRRLLTCNNLSKGRCNL
ncbi:hypothetical protein Alg130_11252 [Pyrenophora tritici-repentis]|nr:hypothetical protein Alg130_11252 [Pyrenophora tritici-repentis]KAI0604553.1 hypothetical protein TUN205_11201 [Pyrenophora tritici-repentis]PZC93732.1 hypothetical protein A1F95_07067 [Pyrenophora tritici-repentis]PZD38618.1 hypothetical protein A1F97_06558 [Pyrenophora tritici-repentis]